MTHHYSSSSIESNWIEIEWQRIQEKKSFAELLAIYRRRRVELQEPLTVAKGKGKSSEDSIESNQIDWSNIDLSNRNRSNWNQENELESRSSTLGSLTFRHRIKSNWFVIIILISNEIDRTELKSNDNEFRRVHLQATAPTLCHHQHVLCLHQHMLCLHQHRNPTKIRLFATSVDLSQLQGKDSAVIVVMNSLHHHHQHMLCQDPQLLSHQCIS